METYGKTGKRGNISARVEVPEAETRWREENAGGLYVGGSIIRPLMGLHPGTKLGNYEIVAPLGAGGMGEVYRARDLSLQREVAVKVLPASFSRDADRLLRFRQEAQATAALNHP